MTQIVLICIIYIGFKIIPYTHEVFSIKIFYLFMSNNYLTFKIYNIYLHYEKTLDS